MDIVLQWIYVGGAVFLLFGAAIFVHEWGHYIVARLCGLKVEAFAIGFGKPIYSWTKDGIEYSLRWIPAGGYVKLPQMLTSEALEGKNGEGEDCPKEEPLPNVHPMAKIAVAFAGPFMNLVFAFAIAAVLYVVGLPVKVNPAVIGYVAEDSEEYAKGIRAGDKIVKVNGEIATSWDKVIETVVIAQTNMIPVEFLRGEEKFSVTLEAKVQKGIDLKMLNLDPDNRPVIQGMENGTPAQESGLLLGDQVISFDGIPIYGNLQFISEIQKRGGKETEILVWRGDEKVSLKVTPRGEAGKDNAKIGAMIGSSGKDTYILMKPGPLPWVLVADTFKQIKGTFVALANSKKTGVKASHLSGPIGILAMLSAQVNADFRLALKFMILLNISLAVMNLLPVPVLDGGHITMAIFESVRGQPMSVKLQEYLTTGFAVLLIGFMLFVSFHDVKRFGMFRSMFSQEVEIESQDAPDAPKAVPSK
ncbi:MAG: RIP metalloprotease RseP [Verrucomicrobiae bacterium]|nr:RIP metalloprotease RseP [Verrucomicrobiae bacterium]